MNATVIQWIQFSILLWKDMETDVRYELKKRERNFCIAYLGLASLMGLETRQKSLIKTLHVFMMPTAFWIMTICSQTRHCSKTVTKKWIVLRYSIHSKCHIFFLFHIIAVTRDVLKMTWKTIKQTNFRIHFAGLTRRNMQTAKCRKRQLIPTWISFLPSTQLRQWICMFFYIAFSV